jgi:hypothetical protein
MSNLIKSGLLVQGEKIIAVQNVRMSDNILKNPKIHSNYTEAYAELITPKMIQPLTSVSRDEFFQYSLYDNIINKQEEEEKRESDEWCFITTACIRARNLDDNGEVLQLLRQFRDRYLKNTKRGDLEIQEYYQIAPKIVSRINQQANSKQIYNYLFHKMILPAVQFVKDLQFDKAHIHYHNCVLTLGNIFLTANLKVNENNPNQKI